MTADMATAAREALVIAETNKLSAWESAPARCQQCAWHSLESTEETPAQQAALHRGGFGHRVSEDFIPDVRGYCAACGRDRLLTGAGVMPLHNNLAGLACLGIGRAPLARSA
jgi:hypothetical protein